MARQRPGRARSAAGKGKHVYKYARDVEPFFVKHAIINHFREHDDMARTLHKFYPDLEGKCRDTNRKSIYMWRKNRAAIEEACKSPAVAKQRRVLGLGTATVLPRVAEEEIVLWIESPRDEGVPVSRFMLQSKALDTATVYGIDSDYFKATWTFQKGFLRRHSLSLRRHTRQGQVTPSDSDVAVRAFRRNVLDLMQQHSVNRVYNADQTAILFRYFPKESITKRGAKTVWVRCGGKDKERVTAMLLGDSTGAKYSPFVVAKARASKKDAMAQGNRKLWHGLGVHVWKEVTALQEQHDVVIYGNTRGWWNSHLSIAFLRRHFGNRGVRDQPPALLLWDDLSSHWTAGVRACAESLNVILVPVPPGCTSVCQPADISWNRPLKMQLRAKWIDTLLEQLRCPREEGERFKLEAPVRRNVIEWTMEAWAALSEAVIKSGFSFIFKDSAAAVAQCAPPPSEQCGQALNVSSALAAELGRLDLLDAYVGEVGADNDVVERTLSGPRSLG